MSQTSKFYMICWSFRSTSHRFL